MYVTQDKSWCDSGFIRTKKSHMCKEEQVTYFSLSSNLLKAGQFHKNLDIDECDEAYPK